MLCKGAAKCFMNIFDRRSSLFFFSCFLAHTEKKLFYNPSHVCASFLDTSEVICVGDAQSKTDEKTFCMTPV